MTISQRSFYETVVTIRVLSEQPFTLESEQDLHTINNAIEDGEVTAWWEKTSEVVMTAPQFAARLLKDNLDPASYDLTDEGEDDGKPDDED